MWFPANRHNTGGWKWMQKQVHCNWERCYHGGIKTRMEVVKDDCYETWKSLGNEM